jgi:CRP-like cAMP-binding protein
VVVSGAVEIRGDCFGEMTLVTGDPRSATVVALAATQLLRLDKERFRALSEQHPVFLRELARVLCRRIARTSEDVAFARRT